MLCRQFFPRLSAANRHRYVKVPVLLCVSLHILTLRRSSFATLQPACAASPPSTPQSVLRFWFGEDWGVPGVKFDDEWFKPRYRKWFSGGAAVDAAAKEFIPLIRAVGKQQLVGPEWQEDVDGLLAQLVLVDQLTRNAFRGTEEAFKYDTNAREIAMRLLEMFKDAPQDVPAPGAIFVLTCLMHSESIELHERAAEWAAAHVRVSGSKQVADTAGGYLKAHTDVLRRFGRYPHRNSVLGRESTVEEEAWLNSDECPGWAKSQRAT